MLVGVDALVKIETKKEVALIYDLLAHTNNLNNHCVPADHIQHQKIKRLTCA